jgi:hypothetical protein
MTATGDLGHMKAEHFEVFFAQAEAVLIAEDGPSARLDELLHHATTNANPAQHANAAKFAAWALRCPEPSGQAVQ